MNGDKATFNNQGPYLPPDLCCGYQLPHISHAEADQVVPPVKGATGHAAAPSVPCLFSNAGSVTSTSVASARAAARRRLQFSLARVSSDIADPKSYESLARESPRLCAPRWCIRRRRSTRAIIE